METRRLVDFVKDRKHYAIASGVIDYFPDALAEVSQVSRAGNEKHNPGEPMHHARGKSMDHADCIARHLAQRGTFEDIKLADGRELKVRHSASLAWRALALLQEELELDYGLSLPRGAKAKAAPGDEIGQLQSSGTVASPLDTRWRVK